MKHLLEDGRYNGARSASPARAAWISAPAPHAAWQVHLEGL